jgi:hypothetical protein
MASNKSTMGLGSVWTAGTRTVTHSLNSIGNISAAADASSSKLEMEAWLGKAEFAKDMVEDLGITGEEGKALNAIEAIAAAESLMKSLRGY